eukprot:7466062-Heterocapsa_arctica.AAC.1
MPAAHGDGLCPVCGHIATQQDSVPSPSIRTGSDLSQLETAPCVLCCSTNGSASQELLEALCTAGVQARIISIAFARHSVGEVLDRL